MYDPNYGIVCWNEAISDTRMALGLRGMLQRPFSILSHKKCIFYFRSAKIGFFCVAATEQLIESYEQHNT
jgi:hypothetical protein